MNRRPFPYQGNALPTELHWLCYFVTFFFKILFLLKNCLLKKKEKNNHLSYSSFFFLDSAFFSFYLIRTEKFFSLSWVRKIRELSFKSWKIVWKTCFVVFFNDFCFELLKIFSFDSLSFVAIFTVFNNTRKTSSLSNYRVIFVFSVIFLKKWKKCFSFIVLLFNRKSIVVLKTPEREQAFLLRTYKFVYNSSLNKKKLTTLFTNL